MKAFPELTQLGIQTTGRLAMIGLVVTLVSVWALIEPVYGLGKWIARGGKSKINK